MTGKPGIYRFVRRIRTDKRYSSIGRAFSLRSEGRRGVLGAFDRAITSSTHNPYPALFNTVQSHDTLCLRLPKRYVQRAPKPAQLMRLNSELGADVALYTDFGATAVISPDGTRLVFVAVGVDKTRHLYVRSLDQMQATVLSGTEAAYDPFFSPDGQWIAFFDESKLKKISVQGGAVVTLCDAPNDRGGSWGDDGSIVFAAGDREGLSKISSAGGNPEPLTALNQQAGEVSHRWPQVLPGSKDVIFTDSTSGVQFNDADIAVYSTFSGKVKTVLHGGSYARYLPSGHLVYVRRHSVCRSL